MVHLSNYLSATAMRIVAAAISLSLHFTAGPIWRHDRVMVSYYSTIDHTYPAHRTVFADRSPEAWHYLAPYTVSSYSDGQSRTRRRTIRPVAASVGPILPACYQLVGLGAVTAYAIIIVADSDCFSFAVDWLFS